MDFIIFIILIALSACFSAGELAFFSLRESQIRLMQKHGDWNAHLVARLKSDPQRLLVVLLIGSNILNVAIASLATLAGISYFDSFGAGIATGVSAVVITLLCDLFPKSFGISHRKLVAQWLAYPVYLCYFLCYPLASLFVRVEKVMQKKFGLQTQNTVSEDEIRIMAELGLEHGEINKEERQMIENIFEFDDIPVGEVMTPKQKIEALSGEVPVEQIAYFVSQSGFSRFPVYDGNDNDYMGYVHTNDVMRVLNSDDREQPIMNFAAPLTRIDERTDIESVFRLMTKERSHMYLVHEKDDPETIVGLVTMENLLEEIVGEIEDEGDRRAKKQQ